MLQDSAYDYVPFIIRDVPVLNDPAIFNQALILRWYSNECDGGFEYAFPSALVAGESVDLGRVKFYAANCTGFFSGHAPMELSWKYDGTEIGFRLLGLYTVNVNATKELILSPLEPDGLSIGNLAWSPVDDRYLYIEFNYSNTKHDLYLAKEGGTATLLLEAIEDITPAWLPDGSGFIYVAPGIPFKALDKNIFQYDLDSGQITRLTWFGSESVENVSISPDGRYIVFQQESNFGIDGPYDSDLWLLDRLNPIEMWKLTDSGNYQSPVWSPKDPVVLDDDPVDDGDDDPADDGDVDPVADGDDDTGDGDGGCFITTMNP